jgi:hypothetical protein
LEDYLIALRVNLKLNKIYLKRKPNKIMINNYSRKVLSMFRSNTDIQYILDSYTCCAYVLDYINKADRGMSKAMEDIYMKHKDDPNSSSFNMLKSLAATCYNASEISAQEVVYILLGIRMVADENKIDVKDVLDEESDFWGPTGTIKGMTTWMKAKNTEKELRMLKVDTKTWSI